MGDVIVINQALRARTSASGKVRYTIDIKSEALVFNLDPKVIGAPAALAIASALRARVTGITAEAHPNTIKARKVAARALSGESDRDEVNRSELAKKERAAGRGHLLKGDGQWAVKRYSGGKLGLMPPQGGTKAFNDSGRFARSIVAMAKADKWIINVAANRLNPTQSDVQRVWRRLIELVPEFANQQGLLADPAVVQAIRVGLSSVAIKTPMSHDELSDARARAEARKRNQNIMAVITQVLIKAA